MTDGSALWSTSSSSPGLCRYIVSTSTCIVPSLPSHQHLHAEDANPLLLIRGFRLANGEAAARSVVKHLTCGCTFEKYVYCNNNKMHDADIASLNLQAAAAGCCRGRDSRCSSIIHQNQTKRKQPIALRTPRGPDRWVDESVGKGQTLILAPRSPRTTEKKKSETVGVISSLFTTENVHTPGHVRICVCGLQVLSFPSARG